MLNLIFWMLWIAEAIIIRMSPEPEEDFFGYVVNRLATKAILVGEIIILGLGVIRR